MRETGEDLLKLVTASAKRRGVLEFLREGPRELREINDKLDTTSSAVLPQIRKLEEAKIVEQRGRDYQLTSQGGVISENLSEFLDLLQVVENNTEFWASHDLDGIPEEFRNRLGELKEGEVIKSGSTEVFEPHAKFMEQLKKSNVIKGLTPIFHPEYPEAFLKLVGKGVDVSLIVTDDVLQRMMDEFEEELEKGLSLKNMRIKVFKGDPRVAFTITDKFLSLGLFSEDEVYDPHHDFINFTNRALNWGNELYGYYRERAKDIQTSD